MGTLRGVIRAAIAVLALVGPAAAACDPDHVDLRGEFGTVRFKTELAVTPQQQARGLMHREELARMASMLFVYDRQQPLAFWMRNTLIPLDMIFVDETGTVINVHAEAVPLDETPIRSAAPGLAVLEINGGLAETLGIGPGDELRSPAMPQDIAAWPCD